MAIKQLSSGLTTTGATTSYTWPGGEGEFMVSGLGGGSIKLQLQTPDAASWLDLTFRGTAPGAANIIEHSTGDGAISFQVPGGATLRGLVTTASTTGINAWLQSY